MCPRGLVLALEAPRKQRRVLVLVLGFQVLGLVLGSETKSSAIILKILINSVLYQFITDKVNRNVKH